MKLKNILLTVLIVTVVLIVIIILSDLQGVIEIRPYINRYITVPKTDPVCRCYRQSGGGTRGFCAQCVNGTLFGCPGQCGGRCKYYRYSVNSLPECR